MGRRGEESGMVTLKERFKRKRGRQKVFETQKLELALLQISTRGQQDEQSSKQHLAVTQMFVSFVKLLLPEGSNQPSRVLEPFHFTS